MDFMQRWREEEEQKREQKQKLADQIGQFIGAFVAIFIPPLLSTLPILWGYNTLSHFVALPEVTYGEMLFLVWGVRTVMKFFKRG